MGLGGRAQEFLPMKRLAISFLLLCLSVLCFAQNGKISVIELRNGSVIRGVILDSQPGTVKIQTADKSVFVYNDDEVISVKNTDESFRVSGPDGKGPKPGFRGFLDLGISQWIICTGTSPIEIETSLGYQVGKKFYVGGGTGIHFRTPFSILDGFNPGYFDFIIPVFADIRVDFIDNSLSPFINLRLGYEFPAKEAVEDIGSGFYVNPMAGVRFYAGKLPMNASIGYTYRQITALDQWFNQCAEVTVKIGIEF